MAIERIEIEIDGNTTGIERAFEESELVARDTKKKLEAPTILQFQANIVKAQKEVDKAKKLLKQAEKDGDFDAEVQLEADLQVLKSNLTEAKRDLRNYTNTGDKDLSRFGRAFQLLGEDVGKSIDKIGGGLQRAGALIASVFSVREILQFGGELANLAGIAEGTQSKFNTVFGEYAKDVQQFIDSNDDAFKGTNQEIQKGLSSFQDLLVPLGLSREAATNASKDFFELANQVGAFNDVATTQVVEDFNSALAGSSETLRKYGINASQTALQQEAVALGLVSSEKAFKNLDIATQNQIKAQALYSLSVKQSSDAINGFEENNDSFLRRQQELTENFGNIKVALGDLLLPVLDQFQKIIIPITERIQERVQENPKLASTIGLIVTAIAGLGVVLSTIFTALLVIKPALVALGVTFGSIALPITAVIGVLAGLGVAYEKNLGGFADFVNSLPGKIRPTLEKVSEAFTKVAKIVEDKFGNEIRAIIGSLTTFLEGAFKFTAKSLEVLKKARDSNFLGIKTVVTTTFKVIGTIVRGGMTLIGGVIEGSLNIIAGIFQTIGSVLQGDWAGAWEGLKRIVGGATQAIEGVIQGWIGTVVTLVTGGLSRLANQAGQRGSNLVQSFANGIKEKINNVVESVSSVAQRVKDILGVSSPTKDGPLAIDQSIWGENLVKAFAKGVEKGKPLVEKRLSELGQLIKDELSKENTDFELVARLQTQKDGLTGFDFDNDTQEESIAKALSFYESARDEQDKIDEAYREAEAERLEEFEELGEEVYDNIGDAIEEGQKKVDALVDKINDNLQEIAKLDDEIANIETDTSNDLVQRYVELQDEIKEARQELTKLNEEEDKNQEDVDAVKAKIEALREENELLKENTSEKERQDAIDFNNLNETEQILENNRLEVEAIEAKKAKIIEETETLIAETQKRVETLEQARDLQNQFEEEITKVLDTEVAKRNKILDSYIAKLREAQSLGGNPGGVIGAATGATSQDNSDNRNIEIIQNFNGTNVQPQDVIDALIDEGF